MKQWEFSGWNCPLDALVITLKIAHQLNLAREEHDKKKSLKRTDIQAKGSVILGHLWHRRGAKAN